MQKVVKKIREKSKQNFKLYSNDGEKVRKEGWQKTEEGENNS